MSYRTRAYFQVSRCYAIEICLPQYPDTSLFFLICFLIFSCFTLAFHLLLQDKCFILRQLNRSIDRYNYFIISEITHCPFRRNTTPVNINVGRNIFLCELLSVVLLSGCRKPFYTSIHYVTLSIFCMTPSTDLVVAIVAQGSDVTNDPLV